MKKGSTLCRSAGTRLRARAFGVALAVGLVAAPVGATEPSPEPSPESSSRFEQPREGGPGERRARREAMRGLRRALPDARPIERLAILRQALRLPVEKRRSLRERLRRFDALAPDERRVLVAELEGLRVEADVERLERNLERWEKLSEEERERYRAQMRRLWDMPLDERRRLLDEWERSGRGAGAGAAPEPDLAPEHE
jgi:hypothetical protein